MMTNEEMMAVIAAHKEGKIIQFHDHGSKHGWKNCPSNAPCWNFHDTDYRIKSEPRYRPFRDAGEVMEAIKEHGDWIACGSGIYCKIIEVRNNSVLFGYSDKFWSSTRILNDGITFADGTPFGFKEE